MNRIIGKIFPDVPEIDNYAKRYYAIMNWMKPKNLWLWKYIYTYDKTIKELERYYGYVQPIKPSRHFMEYYPFAYTELGEIICFKKFEKCPTIAIYGVKGSGKTVLIHTLLEGFYWYWNYLAFIANDYQDECVEWAFPCKSNKFLKKIMVLNKHPTPLPIFLLLPFSDRKLDVEKRKTAKMKIVLPFDYLVNNIEKFVNLGGSEKYFKNIDFSKCKSREDVKKVIDEGVKSLDKRARDAVVGKIEIVLNLFFKDNLVSFDGKAVDKLYLKNDDSFDTPVYQLLKSNVIPTLVTTTIESKEWFGSWWQSQFNSLIQKKQDDANFKNKKLLICIDEINAITGTGNKTKMEIVESIRASIAQGRMLNIATIYAGHHPTDVDPKIRGHSKYVFCFNMNINEDVNTVKNDYNLSRDDANKIKELETFEFIAKSKESPFIVYNPIKNKIYERDFVRGYVFPPMSHCKPETQKEGYFASRYDTGEVKGGHSNNLAFQIINSQGFRYINRKDRGGSGRSIIDQKKEYKEKRVGINIKKPQIIEGVDYSRAFFEISDKKYSSNRIMDYRQVIEAGFMLYEKDKKYYLLKIDENKSSSYLPMKELPKDIIMIQYNPFFRQFKVISKKCDQGWVNEIGYST